MGLSKACVAITIAHI